MSNGLDPDQMRHSVRPDLGNIIIRQQKSPLAVVLFSE